MAKVTFKIRASTFMKEIGKIISNPYPVQE